MLTLKSVLSLPVFLSATLIAHALAAPDGYIDKEKCRYDIEFEATLMGGNGCNDEQRRIIQEGFNDMNRMFKAAVRVNWNGDPERDFFGMQERIQNYTQMIESNLLRASQYGNLKGDTQNRKPDILVRCDDPNDLCDGGNGRGGGRNDGDGRDGDRNTGDGRDRGRDDDGRRDRRGNDWGGNGGNWRGNEGKHVAYNIGNDPHINFCRKYFQLDPLDQKVMDVSFSDADTKARLMSYYNRGTAWARQIMHISAVGEAMIEKVVTEMESNSTQSPDNMNANSVWTTKTYIGPMNTSFLAGVRNEHPKTLGPNNIQALKYAYGAKRSKLLALLPTQMPYDTANNAESYALYALARYVMETQDFYPAEPIIQYTSEAALLADEDLQKGERKEKYACFEEPDVASRQLRMNAMGTNAMGTPISAASSPTLGLSLLTTKSAYLLLYGGLVYALVSSWLA